MITHEIMGDDRQAADAMTCTTDGIEMDARMPGGLPGGLGGDQ